MSDEVVIPEGDVMGNNVTIGEYTLIMDPASQNGEPEPQMTYEDLIGIKVGLAAAN